VAAKAKLQVKEENNLMQFKSTFAFTGFHTYPIQEKSESTQKGLIKSLCVSSSNSIG
jgi:hypothetical protein